MKLMSHLLRRHVSPYFAGRFWTEADITLFVFHLVFLGVLSRVYHLQTSRFLLLALVVMAVQGHRYCHGSAVFHLLRTWSSLGSEQTKKTGHLAGQLFLKSDLNSFYESTFLAKESCKVLAKFGCDENDMADISKVQAFVRQEVLGDP